jgi:hypothetical protein
MVSADFPQKMVRNFCEVVRVVRLFFAQLCPSPICRDHEIEQPD